jgi:xylan 1,4-beta-xylosidase
MTGTRARPANPRIAWFDTLGAQTERDRPAPDVILPAPDEVRAERGRGQVTITWAPVDGAIGYLVHRADSTDGDLLPIDHGGGDVLAVPHGPYVDTTGDIGAAARYAVATLSSIDAPVGELSAAVSPASMDASSLGRIAISVDASADVGPLERPWRPCIGSEHLALMLDGPGPGEYVVGDDLAEAFRIVRRELGVEMVRAHAILHDRLGVYREDEGRPVHDFGRVDAALDRLLETGLRPIVELSFVPRDLASDPSSTVFDYRGIISPPRDLDLWRQLVEGLVRHLVERYGPDEVRRWLFEVWNEANLQVFWTGSEADYFALYDASVAAVKAVDPALRVGGPATSAVGWVDDLLDHARRNDVPIDFVSTHTYGAPPLDLRPILRRFDRPELPLWWTEWGVSPTHGAPVNDSVWGAPLVARGMRSAAGRLHSLAYWVASDQFVELGAPERLFHGGFGLLTVGNLRKPRFWALWILEQLGEREIASHLDGDGAGSLVEAWASRSDGRVAIAAWNGTIDQSKRDGDDRLARAVELTIDGLEPGPYHVRHRRLDLEHSDIHGLWQSFGGDPWPDDFGWERLRERDYLEDLGSHGEVDVGPNGRIHLEFDLPMPAISLIELEPATLPTHERPGDASDSQ